MSFHESFFSSLTLQLTNEMKRTGTLQSNVSQVPLNHKCDCFMDEKLCEIHQLFKKTQIGNSITLHLYLTKH